MIATAATVWFKQGTKCDYKTTITVKKIYSLRIGIRRRLGQDLSQTLRL
jgi:hypothetical protein